MKIENQRNPGDDSESFQRTSAAGRAAAAAYAAHVQQFVGNIAGPLANVEVVLPIRPEPIEARLPSGEKIRKAQEGA